MPTLSRTERLALLLSLLGDEACSLAKEGLSGQSLRSLEEALNEFESYPPSGDEIELVLSDFEEAFQLAVAGAQLGNPHENSGSTGATTAGPTLYQIPEEKFESEVEPKRRFEPPGLTGNTTLDLNKLHPYQVAQALDGESPEVVALVVRSLTNRHAAKTLEYLPDAMRPLLLGQLAKPSRIMPRISELVLEQVLEMAMQVEERLPQEESSDQIADLMRSLPRPIRTPMMEQLEADNPEIAEQVRKKLYRFEDVGKLGDRDMQTLLGKSSSDTLVLALQQSSEEILTKFLSNMSKRAKESLQEEMEFKTNAKQPEIDEARAELVQIMVELDASGAITLE